MVDLWAVLAPILLIDVLNPVLFAFMVYAAGSNRPIGNSMAVLAGHTLAYFIAGLLLVFAYDKLALRMANPERVDGVIEAALGLALIWLAWYSSRNDGKEPDQGTSDLSLAQAFGLGAVINVIGIPFALPYFAALAQIVQEYHSLQFELTNVGLYNAAYAAPFLIVPLLRAVMGEGSAVTLGRINATLERVSDAIMPWLLLGLGLFLVADGMHFFYRGLGVLEAY